MFSQVPFPTVSTMDAANQVNTTEAEEFLVQVLTSSCCSATGTTGDESFSKLDDSMELVGVQVTLILAYSSIILFGVTGNSLVIYVVYRFKKLQTVTNFFIVNLAVSDLLVNILCLPFTLVNTLYGEWKFGQVLCFMLPCAQGMAVHVSTITLNVIALDRHRSIVYHMETKMSKDICSVVIIMTWTVSALLASPLAIFREYQTLELQQGKFIQVCVEKWPGSSMNGSIYSVSMLIVQYCLPLAINCFAYIRIWKKMKDMPYRGRNDHHERRRRTTQMLVTMVVVFAISWLPFYVFQLAVDINSSVLRMKDFKLLFTLFHVVAMCSTFVNPILYGWMNTNYRSAFLSVCRCKWPFGFTTQCNQNRDATREEGRVCKKCKSTNV